MTALPGLLFIPDQAEALWTGEKSVVVRRRHMRAYDQPHFLCDTGGHCYGTILMGNPERIGLAEFRRRAAEHLITEKERKNWWPNAKELMSYRPVVEPWKTPRKYLLVPGAQTTIPQVEFIAGQVQNIADATSYDPAKVDRLQTLLDDHRILHAWAATIKSGRKFEYPADMVYRLHSAVEEELGRRIPGWKSKTAFPLVAEVSQLRQVANAGDSGTQIPDLKNVDAKGLTEALLGQLHDRLHAWYHGGIPGGYSLEDIINLHERLVGEMKRRNLEHPWRGDGLDKGFAGLKEIKPVVTTGAIWDAVKAWPEEIRLERFVSLIGSQADRIASGDLDQDHPQSDLDVLFRQEGRTPEVEQSLVSGLPNGVKFHAVAGLSAMGRSIPVYDLILRKRSDLAPVEPDYLLPDIEPGVGGRPKVAIVGCPEDVANMLRGRTVAFETKAHGMRVLVHKAGQKVKMVTARGHAVVAPELAATMRAVEIPEVMIDGFLDSGGGYTVTNVLRWRSTELVQCTEAERGVFKGKLSQVPGGQALRYAEPVWCKNDSSILAEARRRMEGAAKFGGPAYNGTPFVVKDSRSTFALRGENPGWIEVTFATKSGVTPGVAFTPMKAVKGYHAAEYHDVDEMWRTWASGYIEEGRRIAVEPKFDGIRMTAHRRDGVVHLFTEDTKADRSDYLPTVVRDLKSIPGGDFVIDGEMTLWRGGRQEERHDMAKLFCGKDPLENDETPRFFVFDALWAEGKDLSGQGWDARQEALKKLLPTNAATIKRVVPTIVGSRTELVDAIGKASKIERSEGAMLKVTTGPQSVYDPGGGRTMGWAKFKLAIEVAVKVIGLRLVEPGPHAETKAAWIYRVALVNPSGKFIPIEAEKKIAPKDAEIDTKRQPKYRWRMGLGFKEREPGEYAYGVTYAAGSEVQADVGDVITAQPQMMRAWEGDDKALHFSWMFPRVKELRPERKQPDTTASAERLIQAYTEKEKAGVEGEAVDLATREDAALASLRQMGDPFLVKQKAEKRYRWVHQWHVRGIDPETPDAAVAKMLHLIELADSTGSVMLEADGVKVERARALFAEPMDSRWLVTLAAGPRQVVSVHGDFRMETDSDYLVGYTLATPGNLRQRDKFSENRAGDHIVAVRKAVQPVAWLTVEGRVEVGGVGSTEKTDAYFVIRGKGHLQFGTQKTDFNEWMLTTDFAKFEKDRYNGRWIASLIPVQPGWTKAGEGKMSWQFWKPEEDQKWYVDTHDLEKERAKAKADHIAMYWQKPGIETIIEDWRPESARGAAAGKPREEGGAD